MLAARTIPLIAFMLSAASSPTGSRARWCMQVSHLLSAATQGMVAVLLLTGTAEIWMIVVLEALNGTVAAFTFPAMTASSRWWCRASHIQQANALLVVLPHGARHHRPVHRRRPRRHGRVRLGHRRSTR